MALYTKMFSCDTPAIYTGIGIIPVNASQPTSLPFPFPDHIYTALRDTGSTNSLITQKLVDELGLIPFNICMVQSVHGIQQAPMYYAHVFLPNQITIMHIPVVQCAQIDGCDMLIGMDVIRTGKFCIEKQDSGLMFSFES